MFACVAVSGQQRGRKVKTCVNQTREKGIRPRSLCIISIMSVPCNDMW
jgi:hypothetical protein